MTPQQQLQHQHAHAITRRHFFNRSALGLGSVALAQLLNPTRSAQAALTSAIGNANPLTPRAPMFAPRAKSVIFLHMAGSPPQHELFDYKPKLVELNGQPCPDSLLEKQRFAFIKGHPKLLGTPFKFERVGPSGAWMSEILPHLKTVADKLAIVKSMNTPQFNHAPAQLLLYTGQSILGHPSMGSWVTYGLGSENQNLPGFVVLVSSGKTPSAGKSVWGSGFLPTIFQGVQCRTTGDPVLYVSDPPGINRTTRRRMLDTLANLNHIQHQQVADPETLTRIAQFELAYRMQVSVPNVMDISKEKPATLENYGAQPGGSSFANNCLLARRLVEKGVRFVQLFDWGWDYHGESKNTDIVHSLPGKVASIDRPITALINDLDQRGLLDETLVVWAGEFGRTSMNEERNGSKFLGRDHHPHAFTIFMAGGGVKPGTTFGETDELGYYITEGKTSVNDLQATILHLLGLDPFKFSHPHQGLNTRLIGPTDNATIQHQLIA